MINLFKSDIKIVLLLIILFFIILQPFYLHQGLLLIDTGREFYIPAQIQTGETLYKNIFNIYGPLSYILNSIFFNIFGQKINTLYWAGIFFSIGIVVYIYYISREFLNKYISFLIAILIMFSNIFSTFLYNSNLPYCYAIVYALLFFLISLFYLIKYAKNGNKLFAYVSCFCAGLSIACKYEFIFYPLIILYALIFLRPIGFKGFCISLSAFLLTPFLSFFSLGLNLNDTKESAIYIYKLVTAPTLKLFFAKFRIFIEKPIFTIFGILPILNTVLLGIKFKKIYKDKALFIFLTASILSSAKSFLFLNVNHMGIFLFPICIIAYIILLKDYLKKLIPIILSFSILLFAAEDFTSLKYKNYKLSTSKGIIYTFKKDGEPIKYVSDFILNNTKPEDKVVILPEGCFINFVTDRKGDNFYYNLSPLFYYDVFGEERILSYFKQNMPEYIVILPIDNIEYGKSFFGKDYAQNFYAMILNNYKLEAEKNNIQIFKRKNINETNSFN